MSRYIPNQLQEQLAKLDHVGLSEDRTSTINAASGTERFVVELVALDSMSCGATSISLQTTTLKSASLDQLRALSQRLAAELIYLLEPIVPIEVDEDQAAVQLRSDPPHREENKTRYYELLVNRQGLRLCRFEKMPGNVRQTVPAQLTREVLMRLCCDFVAAVSPGE